MNTTTSLISLFSPLVDGVHPIFSNTAPSAEFGNIIIDGGTPVQTCEFCGRVHFNLYGENMESDELDTLLRKRDNNPQKYNAYQGEIYFGRLYGRTVVHGCPCNCLSIF